MKIWIPRRNKDKDLGRLDLDEVETALLWSIDGKTSNLELAQRTGFAETRVQRALYRLYVEGLISRSDAADDTLISWRPSLPPPTPLPEQDRETEPPAPDGAREFEACESAPTLEVVRSDMALATVSEISDVFTRRQGVPPPGDAPGEDDAASQDPQTSEDSYDPRKSLPTLELRLGTDGDAEISQLSLVAEPIPTDADIFESSDSLPAFEAEEVGLDTDPAADGDERDDAQSEEQEFGPDGDVRTVRVEPDAAGAETTSAEDDAGFGDDDSVRTIQLDSSADGDAAAEPEPRPQPSADEGFGDDDSVRTDQLEPSAKVEAAATLAQLDPVPPGSPAATDWGAGFKGSEVKSGGFSSGSVVSTVVLLTDKVDGEASAPAAEEDEVVDTEPTTLEESRPDVAELAVVETDPDAPSPFAEPEIDDDELAAAQASVRSAEFPANHEVETVQQRGQQVTDTHDDETPGDES